MLSNYSDEEKTEDPTNHRLEKAKKEGKKNYSKELHFLLIILSNILFVYFFRKFILLFFLKIVVTSLKFNYFQIHENNYLFSHIKKIVQFNFIYFLILEFIFLIIALISSMIISNTVFNIKKLKINIKQLNFLSGIKKILSFNTWVELLKNFLSMSVMYFIFYWYVKKHLFEIVNLIFEKPYYAIYHGYYIIIFAIIIGVLGVFPTLLFDMYWNYKKYYKQLKMTHYEIKEEFKQIEGDQNVKNKIREEMKLRTYNSMLNNVHKSNVIITNPIHYAIAIYYDEIQTKSPKILAKGTGLLAKKICKIAKNYSIPMLQSPILARVLYKNSEVGQFISEDFYIIIAEVLAWVWKINKWKKNEGEYPTKPKDLFY